MSTAAAALQTVGAALARGRTALRDAGIESAALDARLLLAHATGVAATRLIADPDAAIDPAAAARYESLLRQRIAREPMAQILGHREFWSLDFAVTRDTLTPRPDSETIVAAALEGVSDRHQALRILDLGTGTGCLLLAVLHELPRATGVGVDRSAAALAVARRNSVQLGLDERAEFCEGDWGHALSGRFDIVISNPPYIPSADLTGLAPEVRHEPRLALDGGPDGLAAYRALAPDIAHLLAPSGLAVLEIGEGQAQAVEGILRDAGLQIVGRCADLAGIERCILARAAPFTA